MARTARVGFAHSRPESGRPSAESARCGPESEATAAVRQRRPSPAPPGPMHDRRVTRKPRRGWSGPATSHRRRRHRRRRRKRPAVGGQARPMDGVTRKARPGSLWRLQVKMSRHPLARRRPRRTVPVPMKGPGRSTLTSFGESAARAGLQSRSPSGPSPSRAAPSRRARSGRKAGPSGSTPAPVQRWQSSRGAAAARRGAWRPGQ